MQVCLSQLSHLSGDLSDERIECTDIGEWDCLGMREWRAHCGERGDLGQTCERREQKEKKTSKTELNVHGNGGALS